MALLGAATRWRRFTFRGCRNGVDTLRQALGRLEGQEVRSQGLLDLFVELPGSERYEHRPVLLLHQVHDHCHAILSPEVVGIVRAQTVDDVTAICEQMRHDFRLVDARILGLNVKHPTAVPNVVVVADEMRGNHE